MPVSYQWENAEQTIMSFKLSEPFSVDEYYAMRPHSDRAIREAQHPVGAVIIIPRTIKLTPLALFHTKHVTNTTPTNLLLMVVVTENALYRGLLDMAHRLIPASTETLPAAESLEAAHELIATRLTQATA